MKTPRPRYVEPGISRIARGGDRSKTAMPARTRQGGSGYIIVEKTIRLLRKNSAKDWVKLRLCQGASRGDLVLRSSWNSSGGRDYRLYWILACLDTSSRLRLFFANGVAGITQPRLTNISRVEQTRDKGPCSRHTFSAKRGRPPRVLLTLNVTLTLSE